MRRRCSRPHFVHTSLLKERAWRVHSRCTYGVHTTRYLLRTTPCRCGYRGDGPCARFGRLNDSMRPRGRNIMTCRVAWRALAMHVWCSHHSLSAPDHAIPMRISWGWSMRTIWTPQRQCAASWAKCYNFPGCGTCTRDATM